MDTLLNTGRVDITLLDKYGNTALDYAHGSGLGDIANAIRAYAKEKVKPATSAFYWNEVRNSNSRASL